MTQPARLLARGLIAVLTIAGCAVAVAPSPSSIVAPSASPTPSLASRSAAPAFSATAPASAAPASPARSSLAPTLQPVALPSLPPTADRPVPADLRPSLAEAPEDLPESYLDGCHVQEGGHASRATCLYANLASKTTIALYGDSHALSWFPAVEGFAARQGWRMLSLTMSSCTPADLVVYSTIFKRIYTECTTWRAQAIAQLVKMHPAVIVVTSAHGIEPPVDAVGHLLSGAELVAAWEAGMVRTLAKLIPAAGVVIFLADTPASDVDPPVCLSAHPQSILACSMPERVAINATFLAADRAVVAQTGVSFIDPTAWVCPSSPCPPVIGTLLVYRDGGHLTATFAASLTSRLGAAILQQLKAHAVSAARDRRNTGG